MKLTCPGCGAIGSVDQFTADLEARACMAAIAELPPGTAKPVLGYLTLFRPAKRTLSWRRARKLLAELSELMASPALHRRGRDWPVTPEMWRQALEQMQDKRETLTLPLKSHGYLMEIVAGLASRAEGDAEAKQEAQLRAGFRAGHGADARAYRARMIASENAARERLGFTAMSREEEQAFLDREIGHD
jgi:hypothetical protein